MKIIFKYLLLAPLLFLVGCGSGSSDSNSDSDSEENLPPLDSYTPETIPPERKEAFDLMLKHEFTQQLMLISGLYKVQVDGDVSYYYISPLPADGGYEDVSLTAYNYLGDSHDISGQCYLPAVEGDTNYYFNTGTAANSVGSKVIYKNQFESESKLPEFSINTPAGALVFVVDHKKYALSQITFNSQPSINGDLVNPEERIAITSVKEKDLEIGTIMAEQCTGVPAKYAPAGFSGLYDTTVIVNGSVLENYLQIDSDGTITNWKYKGDGFGPSDTMNCYKKSDWYNLRLNGMKLMYNQSANYLFVDVLLRQFRWYLSDSGEVISVGSPEPLESVTNEEFDITISTKKSEVPLADVLSMECQ